MPKVTLRSTPVHSFLPSFGYSPPSQGSGRQRGCLGLAAGGGCLALTHLPDTSVGARAAPPTHRRRKRTHAVSRPGRPQAPRGGSRVMCKGQRLPRDQAMASPPQESSREGQRPRRQARRALPACRVPHQPTFPVTMLRLREVK